ncbi:hypothetical protein K7T73_15585 [Bacillus badius]|uniref:hypothetical protein n=1 Tax=Bacillus badius TaxID=1455 RepID=UPI001CC04609|nr:hypothetical protein [Bacillus badius]UAT29965.1 hypothetical protein K7T73_15585 [Bacillus badius]
MYFTLSASRLMKASEVRKVCKEMRDNPVLLLSVDFEAKKRYFASKEKAAS